MLFFCCTDVDEGTDFVLSHTLCSDFFDKKASMTMNRKLFAKGFRHGIPIGLGYLSVAFTFGMKAVADGLSPLEALLISMTNVTSAGQFAGLPLILAQASYLEVALTQLIINLRYALMSLSISQKMDSDMNTPRRLFFSFMNTDEIFAVASSQPGKVSHWYLYGLMTAPYLGWSVGTILGAVAGTLLPVFLRNALGIAIFGMFLAIILPPARKEKPVRIVVLMAIAMSLCFRYVPMLSQVSSGFVIIICAIAASALGAWLFPVQEEETKAGDANFPIYLLVMAGVTYLIRMLPLTIFRKEIKSTFIKSFLHYVPFAVLGAMTIPDVLYSTGDMRTAAVGLVAAVFLAWKGKSLLTVALAACAAVLAAQGILLLF